jgi:hypothetical protein
MVGLLRARRYSNIANLRRPSGVAGSSMGMEAVPLSSLARMLKNRTPRKVCDEAANCGGAQRKNSDNAGIIKFAAW